MGRVSQKERTVGPLLFFLNSSLFVHNFMPPFLLGSSLATGACSAWVWGRLGMARDNASGEMLNKGKNLVSKFPSFSSQNRASLRCIPHNPSGGPLGRSLGCPQRKLLQPHTLGWLISPSFLKVHLRITFLICELCLIACVGLCFWGSAN